MDIDLVAIGRVVRASAHIFAERVLTLVALIACIGLFSWVLWQPDWIRLGAACAFCLLVFMPLLKLETRKGEPNE